MVAFSPTSTWERKLGNLKLLKALLFVLFVVCSDIKQTHELKARETMAMEEPVNEEKILVSVRVRPLNDKEKVKNDVSDWECVNKTVMYKNDQPDRTMSPSAYSFGKLQKCKNLNFSYITIMCILWSGVIVFFSVTFEDSEHCFSCPLFSYMGIDRVFGCDSTTKQVYEEGAKEVALSVVNGINCE